MNVNGVQPRYYHAADPPTYSSATFARDFHTPSTANGTSAELTVYMTPPGRIGGVVHETLSDGSQGPVVPGATIFIAPKHGTLVVDYSLGGSDQIQVTDAGGNYLFDKVIPGQYYVYMIGTAVGATDSFASLATTGDHYLSEPSADPGPQPVTSNNLTPVNFDTIRRGSLAGTVQGVVGDNSTGLFNLSGTAVSGTPIRVYRYQFQGYHGTTRFDYYGTTAWKDFTSLLGPAWSDVTTDGSGNYTVARFTPGIIFDWEHTSTLNYPEQEQYNYVEVESGATPATGFAPVIVDGSLPSNAVRFVVTTDIGKMIRPVGEVVNGLKTMVYPINTTTQNVQLLQADNNTLANIHGEITNHGLPFGDKESGSVNEGYVYCYANSNYLGNGSGAQSGNVGGYRSDLKMIQSNYSRPAYRTGGQTFFDLKWTDGKYALLPNLGTDSTEIMYQLWKPQAGTTASFEATVVAYSKEIVGSVPTYVQLAQQRLNRVNLTLRGWSGNGVQLWTEDVQLDNNGYFLTSPKSINTYKVWNSIGRVGLKPGDNVTMNLDVGDGLTSVYDNFFLDIAPNNDWALIYNWPLGVPFWKGAGSTYVTGATYFKLVKILQTAQIEGKIVDAGTGLPLAGVNVRLTRSGGPAAPFAPVDQLSTTPGGGNGINFHYNPGYYFQARNELNLCLEVSMTGYNTVKACRDGYNGVQWRRDFALVKNSNPPSAPPPTSAGGGPPGGGL